MSTTTATRDKKGRHQFNLILKQDQMEALRRISEDELLSVSDLIRLQINRLIAERER